MREVWKPSITVAAVVEQEGRFLLVEEETPTGICINQPAGHLELSESLQQAVVREMLEETAYDFYPEAVVGSYLLNYQFSNRADMTYLRFTFTGKIGSLHDQPLDKDILRTVWMTRDEILACKERHRSVLVMQSIDDYLKGQRVPLSFLSTFIVPGKNVT